MKTKGCDIVVRPASNGGWVLFIGNMTYTACDTEEALTHLTPFMEAADAFLEEEDDDEADD